MRRFLALCGLAFLHFFALSCAIFSHTDALFMRGEYSLAAFSSKFLAHILLFPVVELWIRSGFSTRNTATFYFLIAFNSFVWALFLLRYFLSRRRKVLREYSLATAQRAAEPIHADETNSA
jgi:hypothetical protein